MKLSILASLCLSAPIWAHDVWVVDSGGGGDFVLVQDAVNAAQPGDTALLRDGSYPETVSIPGKGLQLVGEVPEVSVGRIRSTGGSLLDTEYFMANIAGRVAFDPGKFHPPSRPLVLLDSCKFRAGYGLDNGVEVWDVLRSLTLVDSVSYGVYGGECSATTAYYSSGVLIDEGTGCDLCVFHSSVAGGSGSDGCDCFTCESGEDGGPGITFGGDVLHTHGAEVQGGSGGCGCGPGLDGPEIVLRAGIHDPSTAPVARLRAPKLVREGDGAEFIVEGEPGARVTLLSSPRQGSRYLGADVGALLLGSPLGFQPLGTIPSDGVLRYPFTVDELPAGEEGEMTYYQAVVREQGGTRHLTNPSGMLTLDSSIH